MRNIFQIKNIIVLLVALVVLYACANRGQGPQGGPKDEVPPRMIKSTPGFQALNVTKQNVELEFDENINLKDVAKNVIISPPQRTNPEIRSYGKKIVINFKDTLEANTTYSISFGDGVVDNNEGNILKDFVFSFATGDKIDTLRVAGILINAEDLNPMKGVIVGIQSDLHDSAFQKKPFNRVSRSGDEGRFVVHNVKEGDYRVYALNDLNRDNFYQVGEGAAYLDSVFQPSFEEYMRQDTVWKDSVTVDSVRSVPSTRYHPNNIVLKYFKDNAKRQYLAKSERAEAHKLSILFNTKNDSLPKVRPLNVDWNEKVLLQKNETLDSLTFWLTDSTLIKQDTISLEIKYLKTDSVFKLQPQTDTVSFSVRKAARSASASRSSKKQEFLAVNTNLTSRFDVYKPITIGFSTPIKDYDPSKIHLSQLRDTVLVPIEFSLEKKDSVGMSFVINHKWIPETTYQLDVDSAAFFSIYDLHNTKLKNEMKVRSLEDYSSLKIVLAEHDSTAVFQVVSKDDKVVRTEPAAAKEGTKIEYLEPGDYYVRLFLDRNRNGKWDTGSVLERRQPEEVFYYSKKLTLIKNWEFEENWNHTETPLLKQKPTDLRKTVEPKAEN